MKAAKIARIEAEIADAAAEILNRANAIPEAAGENPEKVNAIPVAAGEIPEMIAEIFATAGEISALAAKLPVGTSEIPERAGEILAAAGEISAAGAKIPVGTSEIRERAAKALAAVDDICAKIPVLRNTARDELRNTEAQCEAQNVKFLKECGNYTRKFAARVLDKWDFSQAPDDNKLMKLCVEVQDFNFDDELAGSVFKILTNTFSRKN